MRLHCIKVRVRHKMAPVAGNRSGVRSESLQTAAAADSNDFGMLASLPAVPDR
jgi:hypothetical protein